MACSTHSLDPVLTPEPVPVRRQRGGTDIFANVGDACSVGRQNGECDQFGRCVQFIPPNEQSVLNQGRTVAECTRSRHSPVAVLPLYF